MINYIKIKDFAIIENAEIRFHQGLNIITGESGSGKSIIVEAMALALGSRADTSLVRSGSEKAVVQMIAEYENQEYIITREISSKGKNLCKINDEVVTLSTLQKLTSQIADIHGQYDNQSLLDPKYHIDLVDMYEKSAISNIKNRVETYFIDYKDIIKKLKAMEEKQRSYIQEKENLEFQLKELQDANLIIGEDVELKETILIGENQEKVLKGLDLAYNIANGEDSSVLKELYKIEANIKEVSHLSKEAKEITYDINDFYYKFEDIINKIRDARDKVNVSNIDLESLSDRLYYIENLKKKYNGDINHLLNLEEKLSKDIRTFDNIENEISAINIEREKIGNLLKTATAELSDLRARASLNIQKKIKNELLDLDFKNANMEIVIEDLGKYTINGKDDIEFYISTNTGEDLKPLSKIASGGEISRIMLAFKSIMGDYDNINSMIFDEIDSGISGQTASKVGEKLLQLAKKHQLIVITHLPQIAALSDHHYKIIKKTVGSATTTTMQCLSEKEKMEEVARLLSGNKISDIAIENAKSLMK